MNFHLKTVIWSSTGTQTSINIIIQTINRLVNSIYGSRIPSKIHKNTPVLAKILVNYEKSSPIYNFAQTGYNNRKIKLGGILVYDYYRDPESCAG